MMLFPIPNRSVALALMIAAASVVVTSADQRLLPFQGYLADPSGSALVDGARTVQFKIYDAPVSGTAVWAGEVHKLSVNGGLVNTVLGTKTAFPERYGPLETVMFSQPLYVEITVDANGDGSIGAEDPPLLPRQVLLPANFAHVAQSAETVEGVDLVKDGQFDLGVIGDGSFPPSKIAGDEGDPTRGLVASQLAEGSVRASEIADDTIGEAELTPSLRERLNVGLIPPGTIVPFAGPIENLPEGWLHCDGNAVSSSVYSDLFAAIGTSWGNGTEEGWPVVVENDPATDFNVPDLRGYFLRGQDHGAGRDAQLPTPQDWRNQSRLSGQGRGDSVGSVQDDELQDHTHGIQFRAIAGSGGNVVAVDPSVHTPDRTVQSLSKGGGETRPKNAYVNYIIKY